MKNWKATVDRVGKEVTRRSLLEPAEEAVDVVAEEMRATVPSVRGRDMIDTEVRKRTPTSVEIAVGPTEDGFFLIFLEVGTAPHPVRARNVSTGRSALRAPGITSRLKRPAPCTFLSMVPSGL